MRIDHIHLTNYRSFPDLVVGFDRQLTVLVGRNGMGKTAVLDGCALTLSPFIVQMNSESPPPRIPAEDIRRAVREGQMVPQTPATIGASGRVSAHDVEWRVSSSPAENREQSQPMLKAASLLLGELQAFADGQRHERPPLPVIAHYGTARLWSDSTIKARKGFLTRSIKPRTFAEAIRATYSAHNPGARPMTNRRPPSSVLSGYDAALEPHVTYSGFSSWFEAVSRQSQRSQLDIFEGERTSDRALALLSSVRAATDHVLSHTGWHSLAWDFLSDEIVATHASAGQFPVSQLSDGVRNALALVADLARRCAQLNPQFGAEAAARTEGIALIDEVDLHLHPGWQQVFVPALLEAFPRVQFVVTTHSPQVITSVPAECVRILDVSVAGASAREPLRQTEGVPANDVLEAVMGVDARPNVPARRQLDEYRALIQDGNHLSEHAVALRSALEKHFGADHPDIIDLDRLIRFQRALGRQGKAN